MKILAMEIEIGDAKPEQFASYLKAEANADEAHNELERPPLVKAGLIRFDIIPLIPYPGSSRLFAD